MMREARSEAQRLILILGPTGVGKSDLAVALAERFGGEIVGADSRQIYRRLDIGTAKPGPEVRRRVPHHLVDFLDPAEPFDLATYQRLAERAFTDIWSRGRRPFLVGGTMQYVRAITGGWRPPAVPPDPELRHRLDERIEREGPEPLYRELIARDPGAAGIVDPVNPRRIVRALEVCLTTGRPFSSQRRAEEPTRPTLKIALTLERPALYERVDRRAEAMFAQGLLEEVATLLADGYDPHGPAFTGIGYREAIACLKGALPAEEALDRLKFATHRYIRQQSAWLRREPDLHWIDLGSGPAAAEEQAAHFIERFLSEGDRADGDGRPD